MTAIFNIGAVVSMLFVGLVISVIVVGNLPTEPVLPESMVNAIAYLYSIALSFDAILPITTLFAAVKWVTFVHITMFVWSMFTWIFFAITGAGR